MQPYSWPTYAVATGRAVTLRQGATLVWSTSITALRLRYGFYLASKLVLLVPGAPVFSIDYLRGPSVVAFEGVLLPLCCTVGAWVGLQPL